MAPEVGFEPTTNRLTADRSTTELLWIVVSTGIERSECCAAPSARQVIWLRGRDLNPRSGGCRIMSCLDASPSSRRNPCHVPVVSGDSPIFLHRSATTPHFARQFPRDRVLLSNVTGPH